MNIFTRRNALIGYLALQALKRSRRNSALGYLAVQGFERARTRRTGRRALRLSLYVALGIVSLGVLAVLVRFWRQATATDEAPEPAAEAEETPAAEESGAEAIAAMEPGSPT
jgi:cytochrome c-type biogenesis protein CcmH/NrfG